MALISVAILLLFLKSIRATLIASLAIPLSLLITFVFLYLTGDTLNLMSLGGLAVAIGLIIDDTVVVIENISRHLAAGETEDSAVDPASKEISGRPSSVRPSQPSLCSCRWHSCTVSSASSFNR